MPRALHAIDPRKGQIVQEWTVPTNVKELHSFLGMARYYRKFVHHFGIISKPLANLLRKGIVSVWTDDTQQSFDTLKLSIAQAAVLGIPNFQKPFVIETDASGDRIGAVLQQDSVVGGHSGFLVTYRRLKTTFVWPGMKKQVKEFVQSCLVCQHGILSAWILSLVYLYHTSITAFWWSWISFQNMHNFCAWLIPLQLSQWPNCIVAGVVQVGRNPIVSQQCLSSSIGWTY